VSKTAQIATIKANEEKTQSVQFNSSWDTIRHREDFRDGKLEESQGLRFKFADPEV